jgi:ectoine hydroxylase-related dioxygenase (phytanoyl-CoA dioxygenase family)
VAGLLARDGCVVVDQLAQADDLTRIRGEMAPFMEVAARGDDIYSGMRTRRTGALVARSPTARKLIAHPLALDAVGRVLAHATGFQVQITQIITLEPGAPAQPIHRDQWVFNRYPFPSGFEVQCGALWALTEFTEDNGATRVIPGSHLFDGEEPGLADAVPVIEEESVPAEMEAGSVLLYTGAIYHGGGENRTDSDRHGLDITYNVSWLRQEENQYLVVPLEIARTLPEPLLRLIGYAHGGYSLGSLDGLRDPIEALRVTPEAAPPKG